MKSHLEELLAFQMKAYKLPEAQRQYRFHPERRWTFDFAWPGHKIAAECEGGIWFRSGKGAHTGGSAIMRDMEKYNHATKMRWQVYRFSDKEIKNGEAVQWLADIFHVDAV